MALNKNAQHNGRKSNGHESVLLYLVRNNRMARIEFMNGKVVEGIIKAYDPYTISVTTKDNTTTVYFKHAILGFTAL